MKELTNNKMGKQSQTQKGTYHVISMIWIYKMDKLSYADRNQNITWAEKE